MVGRKAAFSPKFHPTNSPVLPKNETPQVELSLLLTMILCSCVLRWANSILRLICGSTPAYLTIILLWFLSIFHVTMERFDNGNYLGHFPLLNVISLRIMFLPFVPRMVMKLRLRIGLHMLKKPGLRSYGAQNWDYVQTREAGDKLWPPKVFHQFVPHEILMTGALVNWKCWGERMHSLSFIRYKIKLRQNRHLQHLKCLYTCVDRRHSKQYDEEIDR